MDQTVNTDEMIIAFKEKVKIESQYQKWYEPIIIDKLCDYFWIDIQKLEYTNNIQNPLDISLSFYKKFFPAYYEIIINGIKSGKIIIDGNIFESETDISSGMTYIKPNGNDSDLYMYIHEFGHFIDTNSKPNIIDSNYSIFGETIAFYLERNFEIAYSEEYKILHTIRNSNRLYYEKLMLKKIRTMLKYEQHYKKFGTIDDIIDFNEVKWIMKSPVNNLVNYYLRYPIGNILSYYLITNSIPLDYNLCNLLKGLDILSLLEDKEIESEVKRISY